MHKHWRELGAVISFLIILFFKSPDIGLEHFCHILALGFLGIIIAEFALWRKRYERNELPIAGQRSFGKKDITLTAAISRGRCETLAQTLRQWKADNTHSNWDSPQIAGAAFDFIKAVEHHFNTFPFDRGHPIVHELMAMRSDVETDLAD